MKTTGKPKTNALGNYPETSHNLPAPVVFQLFGLWIFTAQTVHMYRKKHN